MRVYKIYTGLTEDQFSDLNDMLDSSEVYMVETLQDQVLNVDIVENGLVSSYLICDEKSLDFIVSLLYKYEVKFKLKPKSLPSILNIPYFRDYFVTTIYAIISLKD